MAKRVGIIPDVFAQPLFYGLNQEEGPVRPFELVREPSAHLAKKLREKNLDAAFLSPIDYAKDYGMYSIVPDVGASSHGETGASFVIFRENLRTVTSLAVKPSSTSEIVLAHLVFAEKYGSPPTIIPFGGTVEQGLVKGDGVLCTGDEALPYRNNPHALDLVEEWDDMTGLPFVHGMWVARENALTRVELHAIIESAKKGMAHLADISNEVDYLSQFQYDMNDDARAGLAEFFRMAYYHGILPDIPEIRFSSPPDERRRSIEEMN